MSVSRILLIHDPGKYLKKYYKFVFNKKHSNNLLFHCFLNSVTKEPDLKSKGFESITRENIEINRLLLLHDKDELSVHEFNRRMWYQESLISEFIHSNDDDMKISVRKFDINVNRPLENMVLHSHALPVVYKIITPIREYVFAQLNEIINEVNERPLNDKKKKKSKKNKKITQNFYHSKENCPDELICKTNLSCTKDLTGMNGLFGLDTTLIEERLQNGIHGEGDDETSQQIPPLQKAPSDYNISNKDVQLLLFSPNELNERDRASTLDDLVVPESPPNPTINPIIDSYNRYINPFFPRSIIPYEHDSSEEEQITMNADFNHF